MRQAHLQVYNKLYYTILLACLFNIYSEQLMGVTIDGCEKGFWHDGRFINSLTYADGAMLFATSEADLPECLIE